MNRSNGIQNAPTSLSRRLADLILTDYACQLSYSCNHLLMRSEFAVDKQTIDGKPVVERDPSKPRWKGIIFGPKANSRSGTFAPCAVEIVERPATGHEQPFAVPELFKWPMRIQAFNCGFKKMISYNRLDGAF
ncbi:hypothetical protein Tcan_17658 [Toxocara canis]|uniref:Uncharacterized protein n=1 Tax=Toxocara canis TaxID=6265 RepID=A0A0B2UPW3_TOXCA|nr:hypothetical protein Tcan_17658 [Toxocara canis]